MIKSFARVWWVAVLVAWFFDQLFWQKQPGISFGVFVSLALAAGFLVAVSERVWPSWKTLLLLVPMAFFVVMSAMRLEEFTQFLNYALTLTLMGLMAVSFAGGRWQVYTIGDYLVNLGLLLAHTLVLPPIVWDNLRKAPLEGQPSDASASKGSWKPLLVGVLRGLLLALPVVSIFAVLLASADPVFSQGLEDLLTFFRLEQVPEYIFRLAYIGALAYGLMGVYLHALTRSQTERASAATTSADGHSAWRFLPFTESTIILGSVDLLFAAFVAVQFRYFFGGQANINVAGYTYSEYARRGFFELVVVAVFSLLLYLGLSHVVRRERLLQRWSFSALGVGLALLVSIILASGFQRLLLYEQVYGFSELRLYTHVFMIWLGVLLVLLIGLELIGRLRNFALGVLLVALGFGVTLNLVNVNDYIVRQNVIRALNGYELDVPYLFTLSDDTIPALVDAFHEPGLDAAQHDDLGAALACRAAVGEEQGDLPWQSWHWSRYQARTRLTAIQRELSAYPVTHDLRRGWLVTVGEEQRPCFGPSRDSVEPSRNYIEP